MPSRPEAEERPAYPPPTWPDYTNDVGGNVMRGKPVIVVGLSWQRFPASGLQDDIRPPATEDLPALPHG